MKTLALALLAALALACSSNKAPADLGKCSTSQECPPDQVCLGGRCSALQEGHAVGTFECVRDAPAGETGRTDAVARVNGKNYFLSTYVTCTSDKSSVVEGLYFTIVVSGTNKGSAGPDQLTLFTDEVLGNPGEPRALIAPGDTPSKNESGYLTEDDVGGNIRGLRIVAWVTGGTLTIDEWPPKSGATLHGKFDAILTPGKAGFAYGAECTSITECGDSPVGKCLDIANGKSFCWTECDKDDERLWCAEGNVCIGWTTPLGSPRLACVPPCTASGGCDNPALKCRTGTNGKKGCYR